MEKQKRWVVGLGLLVLALIIAALTAGCGPYPWGVPDPKVTDPKTWTPRQWQAKGDWECVQMSGEPMAQCIFTNGPPTCTCMLEAFMPGRNVPQLVAWWKFDPCKVLHRGGQL